jgi:hypothetical protein
MTEEEGGRQVADIVYTLGIAATGQVERNPRSWQAFTNFLASHPGLVIVDLRLPRNTPQELSPWNGSRLDYYFHSERDYSYLVLGHLLTELYGIESQAEQRFPGLHKTIAIKRLIAILRHGKDLLCFCEQKLYAGSVRELVVKLILEQLPDTVQQELDLGLTQ